MSYLSEVLLLRSEVVETSSKLSVPSELGEGNSRWGELCHFVSAGKNWMVFGLMGEVGRDAGGVRTAVVFVGIDRFMVGERWMKKRVSQ